MENQNKELLDLAHTKMPFGKFKGYSVFVIRYN
ncbi:putative quorum-sensing-regulated virulence factor [Flavobacterium sp. N2155]